MTESTSGDMQDTIDYYTTTYDEDTRLTRHRVEFATTTYILDTVIEPGMRVLDVATGTGAYAIYYAEKGCTVQAMDIVPRHVDILNTKLGSRPDLKLSVQQGDARDLSRFAPDSFDVVLCMGPIYHIPPQAIDGCINACLRVLRDDGILAVAYVNQFEGYESDKYFRYFRYHSPAQIEALLARHDVERLHNVPTDGTAFAALEAIIERAPDDLSALHDWLAAHPDTFDVTGNHHFMHGLWVGSKRA